MPLSEEEMRLLEQMERALAEEDPKFASALRGRRLGHSPRFRLVAAGVVFFVGLALLLGGAAARLVWLAVVGFVVMLVAATAGLAAWRSQHAPAHPEEPRVDYLPDPTTGETSFRLIEGGRADRSGRRLFGRRRRSGHAPSTRGRPRGRRGHTGRSKQSKQGTFMQRVERRWQERRQGF